MNERKQLINLYVIYDKLAEKCGPVFEADNDAVACRAFRQIMSKSVSDQDYDLYCVGKIDQQTMDIIVDLKKVYVEKMKDIQIKMFEEVSKDGQ